MSGLTGFCPKHVEQGMAMNPDQAVFELELYGYTVLPSVISAAEAAELARLVDDADARIGMDYSYDDAFARLVPCVPALGAQCMALVDNPQVLDVIERAIGLDLVLGSMNCRIVRPGDPDQGLHSDIPAVHRRVIGPPVMLQAVWMVDGFTEENGATRIIPGSHRHPEAARSPASRPSGQRDDFQWAMLAWRRGEPQPSASPGDIRSLPGWSMDALPD
jgi:ectoine hydroxylase-related dioxygenase (phytanoyl-CoA dioxygenase family)